MYYYLRGRVSLVTDEMAVIDVGGIGFEISIINPHDFIVGEEMLVYTQHIVKDDDELLVGFRTKEEKNLFNKLITVKGIGPKTAISALHNVSVDELINEVNSHIVNIGAQTNRLESIIDAQSSVQSTLYASLSTFKDADIAEESAEYIRASILQNAASALFASYNNIRRDSVLALINGIM